MAPKARAQRKHALEPSSRAVIRIGIETLKTAPRDHLSELYSLRMTAVVGCRPEAGHCETANPNRVNEADQRGHRKHTATQQDGGKATDEFCQSGRLMRMAIVAASD